MSEQQREIWLERDSVLDPLKVTEIRHSFSDHPLLGLESLKKLALRLQRQGGNQIKFVKSGTKSEDPLHFLDRSDRGLILDQVFDHISEPGSWVSLYNVQTDPQYRQLINDAMSAALPLLPAKDQNYFQADGFIFISSAPSATPFHIDRENNFFLQIHGKKRLSVWDPFDRHVVPETEIEKKIGRGLDSSVTFRSEYFERAGFNRELSAGEGVYFPSTSGHTTNTENLPVRPDDSYSISIGIVFYTPTTRRAAYIYSLNDFLRRFNFQPLPPYISEVQDRIKFPLGRALVLAKKYFRGFNIPPGM